MPGENGENFTTRTNGLDVYVRTYLAVAKALKAVVPGAAFGPSNMAGLSGGANGGVSDVIGCGVGVGTRSRPRSLFVPHPCTCPNPHSNLTHHPDPDPEL